MLSILSILSSMSLPTSSPLGELSKVIKGIYNISTGGVTQKNISRQTRDSGYSYRSVQRFFKSDINWDLLYLSCIHYFFKGGGEKVYLLAIDEVVEAKSGKSTHLLGRFYSSIAGHPIASVCFHVLSLIEVSSRKSFVATQEQREAKSSKEVKEEKSKIKTGKTMLNKRANQVSPNPKGRPKGSKDGNNTRVDTGLSLSFERLLMLGLSLLVTIGIVPSYIVADSAYSSKTYLLICQTLKISLISKLRCTSVLYLPATQKESKAGKGRPPKYGERINLENLDKQSGYFYKTLREAEDKSNLVVDVYHFPKIWTKFLPVQINVVVLVIKNTRTNTVSRRILYTTDLALCADLLIEYYSLRFQIEFNFRDAKQYFGLADFKAYKSTQVKNSAGLAFFMVNFTHIVRKKVTELWGVENLSILDLKAGFRAEKQLERILKHLNLDVSELKKQADIKTLATIEAINLNVA